MWWLRLAFRGLIAADGMWIEYLVVAYFLQQGGVGRRHLESAFFILAALALIYVAMLDRAGRNREQPRSERWALVIIAAVGAALLVYWRALGVGWLSDDWVLADWAKRGEIVPRDYTFVRPVPLLLWRVTFMVGGGPGATHAINVVLHGVNAALTAAVARRLGARRAVALISGGIFLIWPTQVEAVVWASAVFDVLMATFALTAVLLYTQIARQFTYGRALLLAAITASAVLTKETAVALPGLLLVVSLPRWKQQLPSRGETLTLCLISTWCAGYLAWHLFLRQAGQPAIPTLTRYALKELVSRTFASLAVPFDRDTIASHPIGVALLVCGILVFSVVTAIRSRQREPEHVLALQGLAWPIVAAAPALGYLFIGPDLQGSRYLYLPTVGWAWFLTSVTELQIIERRTRNALHAATLFALGVVALLQVRMLVADWRISADMRDGMLAQAARVAVSEGCREMRLAKPPLPHKGTQLFLNGFEQAFDSIRPAGTTGSACVVTWDETGLHREH